MASARKCERGKGAEFEIRAQQEPTKIGSQKLVALRLNSSHSLLIAVKRAGHSADSPSMHSSANCPSRMRIASLQENDEEIKCAKARAKFYMLAQPWMEPAGAGDQKNERRS